VAIQRQTGHPQPSARTRRRGHDRGGPLAGEANPRYRRTKFQFNGSTCCGNQSGPGRSFLTGNCARRCAVHGAKQLHDGRHGAASNSRLPGDRFPSQMPRTATTGVDAPPQPNPEGRQQTVIRFTGGGELSVWVAATQELAWSGGGRKTRGARADEFVGSMLIGEAGYRAVERLRSLRMVRGLMRQERGCEHGSKMQAQEGRSGVTGRGLRR
jgi:hypothetical protein